MATQVIQARPLSCEQDAPLRSLLQRDGVGAVESGVGATERSGASE